MRCVEVIFMHMYSCKLAFFFFFQKLPTPSSADVITVHVWPQNHMIVHACVCLVTVF